MPFQIIRNDIVNMNTEAIVNTANEQVSVSTGCDYAVYMAAGYEELLNYRREHIGIVKEGEAFITPGFQLKAKYIIHAVSPFYEGGKKGEEVKLRSCYQKSLALAKEHKIKSIAFPLISTGSFGYPKEEGMRIAVDEIHAFLLKNEMQIYLVVFDSKATKLGEHLYPDLESYIDHNYVIEKRDEEYNIEYDEECDNSIQRDRQSFPVDLMEQEELENLEELLEKRAMPSSERKAKRVSDSVRSKVKKSVQEIDYGSVEAPVMESSCLDDTTFEFHESKLAERMEHLSDTFSEYLLYLIQNKGMDNASVYKRAILDKKIFSKIKNHKDYHPQKMTALCLCIGAKLNLDETKDLLARAGYALSPCDKTDIIFSYFIENEIYDMIELDIQLEEHGLPCIIT